MSHFEPEVGVVDTSKTRLRDPKPNYRTWAAFDPYKDNVGCTIRVARRPSSLIAPPKVTSERKINLDGTRKAAAEAEAPTAASRAAQAVGHTEAAKPRKPRPPGPLPASGQRGKPPHAEKAAAPVAADRCEQSNVAKALPLSPERSCAPVWALTPAQEAIAAAVGADVRSAGWLDERAPAPAADGATGGATGSAGALVPDGFAPFLVERAVDVPLIPSGDDGGDGGDGDGGDGPSGPSDDAVESAFPSLEPELQEFLSGVEHFGEGGDSGGDAKPIPSAALEEASVSGLTSAGGVASAAASSPSFSVPNSPSLSQLDELDAMLQSHQEQLKRRVEQVKADKERQHAEWIDGIQSMLPTPQKPAQLAPHTASVAASVIASLTGGTGAGENSSRSSNKTSPARDAVSYDGMPSPIKASTPPRSAPKSKRSLAKSLGSGSAGSSPAGGSTSARSSLESLEELEALLEQQHEALIAKGFIPKQPWRASATA